MKTADDKSQRARRLPEPIRSAFDGRVFLNLRQLADAFGYSPRTLRRHCDAGNLNFHQRGMGSVNRHRVFTLADVEAFWNTTERMEHDELNARRRKARLRSLSRK